MLFSLLNVVYSNLNLYMSFNMLFCPVLQDVPAQLITNDLKYLLLKLPNQSVYTLGKLLCIYT